MSTVIITGGTYLRENAFYYCNNIKDIIIPRSITNIEAWAFYYCSGLENIYYTGTVEEWNNIDIDKSKYYFEDAKKYFYSSLEPTDTSYNYWYYDENDNIAIWVINNIQ